MELKIGAYTFGNMENFKSKKEAKEYIMGIYPTLNEDDVERHLKPLFRNERETNQSDNIAEAHPSSNKADTKDSAGGDGGKEKRADKSK
jgi:hypothetical protein|nr:MAG TPA: hypothetical protein [Caudoviricetes sp.]